jgi:hypothetical protein
MRIQTVLAALLVAAIATPIVTPAAAGDVVMRKGTKSFQTVQRSEGGETVTETVTQVQTPQGTTNVVVATDASQVAEIAPAAGVEQTTGTDETDRQPPRHSLPRK